MTRLFKAGFSLLPLGGASGKTPLVKFSARKRLPLDVVFARMAQVRSRTYGIRLNGLLVIDVDNDTPEVRTYVTNRFGEAPVNVRTRRGYHLYYRYTGAKPKTVREPGIAIDFKAGPNEYVVGPRSERPDGTTYRLDGALPGPAHLPLFVDRDVNGPPPKHIDPSGLVEEGHRHDSLKRRAHELALEGRSHSELTRELLAFRDTCLFRPEAFSDEELVELANWYCEKRSAGKLWGGSHSVVPIERSAIDRLLAADNGVATLLFLLLSASHQHQPDTPFAIVPDALRAAGPMKAGRRQIYNAITALVKMGLLVIARSQRRPNQPKLFLLGNRERRGEV